MSSGGGNRSDGVDLLESDSLGQDGRRRLSGGRLSESKSRQSGDGEHGELHLDSSKFGVLFWCRSAHKLSKRREEMGASEAQVWR